MGLLSKSCTFSVITISLFHANVSSADCYRQWYQSVASATCSNVELSTNHQNGDVYCQLDAVCKNDKNQLYVNHGEILLTDLITLTNCDGQLTYKFCGGPFNIVRQATTKELM